MKRQTLAALALLPLAALAHPGGTDVYGCHRNRKAGNYHCHTGPLNGQTFRDRAEMLEALPPAKDGTPALAANRTGVASVVDGDTLEIHGQRIRLYGIDAPESDQLCRRDGERYRCGQQAALALADKIGRRTLECAKLDRDRYGRDVSICKVAGEDVNGWMVAQGHALAYRAYSSRYVPQETEAKEGARGIWAGTFGKPWDFRDRKKTKKP